MGTFIKLLIIYIFKMVLLQNYDKDNRMLSVQLFCLAMLQNLAYKFKKSFKYPIIDMNIYISFIFEHCIILFEKSTVAC